MGPPLSWVWMKSVERECERWRKGTMCCVGRESGRSETLRPRGGEGNLSGVGEEMSHEKETGKGIEREKRTRGKEVLFMRTEKEF